MAPNSKSGPGGWLSRLIPGKPKPPGPVSSDANVPPSPPLQPGEVHPPWIEQPGALPYDFYWREAGEPWLTQVWEPYYNALSAEAQQAYLVRWNVPQDWQDSYFDQARRDFWDHVDDPD